MKENLFCEKKNAWKVFKKDEKKIHQMSEDYIEFLDKSKTERACVTTIVDSLKKDGYKDIESFKKLSAGAKFYHVNRGKTVMAGIIGKDDIIKNGLKYIVSHVDVPHLHLKPDPLFEDSGFAMFKTQYYGGIKKHHWVNVPLALYGTVYLKDGKEIEIRFGDDGKNVLLIPDLAIHIDKDVTNRKYSEIIKGEELNPLIGSIPVERKDKNTKDAVKENILKILNQKYNITEREILTGEFQIVPAHKACEVGIDGSMIGGFGHDDRVCAYASLKALHNVKKTSKTVVSFWFDREEIGSIGNTGAESIYFEYVFGLIIEKIYGNYNELMLKRSLEKSCGISADVSPAYDPNFKSSYDKQNTALFGYGPLFHKYSGSRGKMFSNEVSPKFLSEMTNLFDKNEIPWQMQTMGKVDAGGGGTIANCLCNLNTEVVDSGVPILGLHSPFELVSKVDLFATCKAYQVFLEEF
jgi:aspartyl aminopeptidase